MRLADLRVRHRIIALAAIPLTAALLLTVPLVAERVQSARESAQSAGELRLAQQVGGLIADLQRERLFSGAYLATPGSDGNPIVQQTARTDADLSDLRNEQPATDTSPVLEAALREVSDLDKVRSLVLKRALTPADVNTQYGSVISALIDALPLSGTADENDHGAFGREQATMEALLRVHESSSSFGALLLAVVSDPEQARQLMADVEGRAATESSERNRFFRVASPSEGDLFQTVESGSAAAAIKSYADALTLWAYSNPDSGARWSTWPDGVTASDILDAAHSLDQLRLLVQNKIARDSAAVATDDAADAGKWALAFIVAALALASTMVWLAAGIARSIAKPLSILHGAAEQVAQAAEDELTRVAEETARTSVGGQTPVRLSRVPTVSKDELGQLAVAFNRVQDAAVALMTRQVRSRENAAAMLGNVGRRTQNLAALQLLMIDRMERSETDPALLEGLYRLDHVSSRLRRYADSLVVLSGWAEPVLVNSPVPLGELTRSALGKIEGFRRVQVGNVPALRVASHVAADLALVIAELLDNATSFSPPTAPVELVTEELPGGRCLIRIVDHGVGVQESRLAEENARLVRGERLDLVSTDFLGLFVVGRLSRRHHLQVRLEHTPGGGVTARITMPAAVFHVDSDPAADRELAASIMPQSASLAPVGDHRASVPPQQAETAEAGRRRGSPSLAVVSSAKEQPVTVERIDSDASGKASCAPTGTGTFDWFTMDRTSQAKPVLNQGLTAVNFAPSRGGRPSSSASERGPESVPMRPRRRAAVLPPPSGDVPTRAVMPSVPERPGDSASRPVRLVRRVPGAQMPAGSFVPSDGRLGGEPMDPEAARAMIEEFEAGVARATESRPSP